MTSSCDENPFRLWHELGELMTKHCAVICYNQALKEMDAKIANLLGRFNGINFEQQEHVG